MYIILVFAMSHFFPLTVYIFFHTLFKVENIYSNHLYVLGRGSFTHIPDTKSDTKSAALAPWFDWVFVTFQFYL